MTLEIRLASRLCPHGMFLRLFTGGRLSIRGSRAALGDEEYKNMPQKLNRISI
jgi:hypothetical protein